MGNNSPFEHQITSCVDFNNATTQMSERAKLMEFAGKLDMLFDEIWSIAKSKEAKAIADTYTKSTLIVRKELINSTAKLPR